MEVDISKLRNNAEVKPLWYADLCSSQATLAGRLVTMSFPSGPVYTVNEDLELRVSSDAEDLPSVHYAGTRIPVSADGLFTFRSTQRLPRYPLEVGFEAADQTTEFVLLGPDEARGYPAYVNIEPCPKCNARQPAGCKCTLNP
jgi:hypothetical protein